MLKTEFFLDAKGITVPYPPLFDNIRRNYGFLDLRGRPDLVAKVPEALQSNALKQFLIQMSHRESPLFALGCDLGDHVEVEAEEGSRHIAGGYVQLISSAYADRSSDDYHALGTEIGQMLEVSSEGFRWLIQFKLTMVALNLDNFFDLTPSLWIWLHAMAPSPDLARASREELISALRLALIPHVVAS